MCDHPCLEDVKDCSFRVFDLGEGTSRCSFIRVIERIEGNRHPVPDSLLNRACESIRTEELRLRFLGKIRRKRTIEFLENVEIGDIVFCCSRVNREVKVLEKPNNLHGFCKCQTRDGEIIKIQMGLIYRISKGNFCGEYFLKETDDHEKLWELDYNIKYYGFRSEIIKKKGGFLLKIFGDSQREVDDFINLYIRYGFILY